jgi:hypothetical protein
MQAPLEQIAVCGMTLSAEPARNTVIEITAACTGSTLRDTIDWIWLMICAPTRIGSTVMCGRAACPPRPSISIVSRSADAICGPGRSPNWPSGSPGKLCMP